MLVDIENISDVQDLLLNFGQNVGNTNNPFLKIKGYVINDEIIGCLVYEYIYDRIEIDYIYVDVNYRCKKIASKLLESILSFDVSNISLEVREDNIPAIKLYEKFSFEIVGKRKKYYGNKDGLLMVRRCKNENFSNRI